jgi:serine/threonine protein kinase
VGQLSEISGTGPGTFPGVEVLEVLGRGAETAVYRIRRRGAEYALKLLVSRTADAERAMATVRREAALLGCVDHPLLPRIYEVGMADAGPYLILELIAGVPLSEPLRAGRLDEARAVRLAIDVAGALAAAHRTGLVHRDVKPDNIMITPVGPVRAGRGAVRVRHGYAAVPGR